MQVLTKMNSVNLIVKAEALTAATMAVMCASRGQPRLICDRCLQSQEPVVVAMVIDGIGETFALCGPCAWDLPKGYTEV
jgi:hypothetical protein